MLKTFESFGNMGVKKELNFIAEMKRVKNAPFVTPVQPRKTDDLEGSSAIVA